MEFNTAQEAFEHYYFKIVSEGKTLENTKFLRNQGFYIKNPIQNEILTEWRKWSYNYALDEWAWYLSGDRSVSEIKKKAKIWDTMHKGDDIVNSNYGYQWQRNGQLDYVINELIRNPSSRRAVLSIYDGKEHKEYEKDTPCTLNIILDIDNGVLNMTVLMRSNDLWYGFCNDQFCFSNLQIHIANVLGIEIGWYYHFAHNLHLYTKDLEKHNIFYAKLKEDKQ